MSQSPSLPSNSLSLLVLANILNEINADPDWPSNERADDDGAVYILYGILAMGAVLITAALIAAIVRGCALVDCREAAPEPPEDPDPESEYEEGKLLTVPPSQRYGAINR